MIEYNLSKYPRMIYYYKYHKILNMLLWLRLDKNNKKPSYNIYVSILSFCIKNYVLLNCDNSVYKFFAKHFAICIPSHNINVHNNEKTKIQK